MGVRRGVLLFACPKCGAKAGAPCVRVGPTYVPGPRGYYGGGGHNVMRNIGQPIAIAHNERITVERAHLPITWADPLPTWADLPALRRWLREHGHILTAVS